ncbi:hypothetical protein XH89_00900 [Bradyrhizobium sp. CCBAU 53340]|uniref:hypothetical protein n=1 Tax=Bradyrhizobium sp. CCBAU 53340 TaxID=1325112 RepID=UPI00188B87C5|nr:hypothetical protein [Bradyrhizobium sp. CCBAU 53340]QOZ42183.1 hypothetical protein XH89_00900 [Bradyrhizobium sp. CCBAU 53340]
MEYRACEQPEITESDVFTGLSQTKWDEIFAAAAVSEAFYETGQSDIEDAIEKYLRRRSASRHARTKIDQVVNASDKIHGLVKSLIQDDAFMYSGAVAEEDEPNFPTIVEGIEGLLKLRREMVRVRERFKRAHKLLDVPEEGALTDFVCDLLMIQANWRNQEPPTSSRESSSHPRFRNYVFITAQAADSSVKESETEFALNAATRSFKMIKSRNADLWADHWKRTPVNRKK